MKKIFFLALSVCAFSISAVAQHDHSSHPKTTEKTNAQPVVRSRAGGQSNQQQVSKLLASYYNIKNALVAGDAGSAASNAGEFLKTANTIDFKLISEGNIHILSKDAGKLSNTKDLQKQREYFAGFSSNMTAVVKALKTGEEPVYVQFCPMKKASWLSNEKEIRNPYYGSTMLTCGEVKETLNSK